MRNIVKKKNCNKQAVDDGALRKDSSAARCSKGYESRGDDALRCQSRLVNGLRLR